MSHQASGVRWGHELEEGAAFISHKLFIKSFCKSQFLHKSVNLFLILVIIKDKFTDLFGN